jgi:hypothetical protein
MHKTALGTVLGALIFGAVIFAILGIVNNAEGGLGSTNMWLLYWFGIFAGAIGGVIGGSE